MGGGPPSAGGPGTPNRHGQLPPSVIISPSAPVSRQSSLVFLCGYETNRWNCSTYLHQEPQRLCLTILRRPRLARSL